MDRDDHEPSEGNSHADGKVGELRSGHLRKVRQVTAVETDADGLVAGAEQAEGDEEEVARARLDGVVGVDQHEEGGGEGLGRVRARVRVRARARQEVRKAWGG